MARVVADVRIVRVVVPVVGRRRLDRARIEDGVDRGGRRPFSTSTPIIDDVLEDHAIVPVLLRPLRQLASGFIPAEAKRPHQTR